MGSHFKKLNLNEAEENFTLISEMLRKSLKGGCSDCSIAESAGIAAYSKTVYDSMVSIGSWSGGYVCGMGYVSGGNDSSYSGYAGDSNYCSKHKLTYLSTCPLCVEENMPGFYGGTGIPGSGGGTSGNYPDPYAGNYGGYPDISGVTRLPDRDMTYPSYFQSQVNGDSLQACKNMMSKFGTGSFGDPYHVYQLKKEVNGVLADYGTDSNTNFHNAIDCINRHLDSGRLIIVGVNHTLNSGQNEGTTDQFVLITGRGYDPAKHMYYYIYVDPARTNASDGCNTIENRLYCDAPAARLYDDSTYLGKRFDVTQVRPNDGKKPEELVNSTTLR